LKRLARAAMVVRIINTTPTMRMRLTVANAKANYVDHTLTEQNSVLRLIEDNWQDHARVLENRQTNLRKRRARELARRDASSVNRFVAQTCTRNGCN
jgi:hypothetical protein